MRNRAERQELLALQLLPAAIRGVCGSGGGWATIQLTTRAGKSRRSASGEKKYSLLAVGQRSARWFVTFVVIISSRIHGPSGSAVSGAASGPAHR